jgi:ferrous iron transport protein B
MDIAADTTAAKRTYRIAICGNPNSGKTTIFNVITGLNQRVANYPGVTVEKVSGHFSVSRGNSQRFTLIDVPGTYSLAAFSPDEFIAISALSGDSDGQPAPDAIICVIDATNLERGLYLLLQVLEISRPVVVALNMIDLVEKRGMHIDYQELSNFLGGIPIVPVVGNRGIGIPQLKKEVARLVESRPMVHRMRLYDEITETLLADLQARFGNSHRTRADYLRIIFDVNGLAERKFVQERGEEARLVLERGREAIKEKFSSFSTAETAPLTGRATAIQESVLKKSPFKYKSLSEKADRYLLHPVLGPIVLTAMMIVMFQAIFSWAQPFMELIDGLFGVLAHRVEALIAEGPMQSLIVDGVIGGVGSVLMFIPQIVILFVFISLLEDSGYMARAAFLVDRLFRWCGLSGKSFIPMLSSFACAVPGIMATRTIEDRKLRFITIMVAPLMTCSARLPVYAIMIAAFIPYKTYLGVFNLQGLVLTMLYLLGIIVAVIVSFVLKKLIFKSGRGTFFMEMPTYKMPTLRSTLIRVFSRVRSFVERAGTVIIAITIIIWALSYYPRSQAIEAKFQHLMAATEEVYHAEQITYQDRLNVLLSGQPSAVRALTNSVRTHFAQINNEFELAELNNRLLAENPVLSQPIHTLYEMRLAGIKYEKSTETLDKDKAGEHLRNSYFARLGRAVEPAFRPLGWDWKITMATLSSFPAREVIIATLGTIYNLGSEIDETSSSLITKMRQARWEEGSLKGRLVFTPAVALSIMVFFALCCQCGATVVTIRKETAGWLYAALTFGYMTILAYLAALGVYQLFSRMWP